MTKRNIIAFGALFLAFSLGACSYFIPKTELQKEADTKAQDWWDTTVAKCGSDYYIKSKWRLYLLANIYMHEDLYEFRSPGFSVKEEPLTNADRLNGYEWRGAIIVPISAHRFYNLGSYDEGRRSFEPARSPSWSSWINGPPERPPDILTDLSGTHEPMVGTSFNKQKGQWNYSLAQMQKQPNCSEVPQ